MYNLNVNKRTNQTNNFQLEKIPFQLFDSDPISRYLLIYAWPFCGLSISIPLLEANVGQKRYKCK